MDTIKQITRCLHINKGLHHLWWEQKLLFQCLIMGRNNNSIVQSCWLNVAASCMSLDDKSWRTIIFSIYCGMRNHYIHSLDSKQKFWTFHFFIWVLRKKYNQMLWIIEFFKWKVILQGTLSNWKPQRTHPTIDILPRLIEVNLFLSILEGPAHDQHKLSVGWCPRVRLFLNKGPSEVKVELNQHFRLAFTSGPYLM